MLLLLELNFLDYIGDTISLTFQRVIFKGQVKNRLDVSSHVVVNVNPTKGHVTPPALI